MRSAIDLLDRDLAIHHPFAVHRLGYWDAKFGLLGRQVSRQTATVKNLLNARIIPGGHQNKITSSHGLVRPRSKQEFHDIAFVRLQPIEFDGGNCSQV